MGDTRKRRKPEMRSSCSNPLDLHWSARPQPSRGSALSVPHLRYLSVSRHFNWRDAMIIWLSKSVQFSDGLAGPTSPWACSHEPWRRITVEQSKEKPSGTPASPWPTSTAIQHTARHHRAKRLTQTEHTRVRVHTHIHTHTRARAHTHTRARAHTHTHTHTHTQAHTHACTHQSSKKDSLREMP